MHICFVTQYKDFQTQSLGGALNVLEKYLRTVLDEVQFMVNLYSFPLPTVPLANISFPK